MINIDWSVAEMEISIRALVSGEIRSTRIYPSICSGSCNRRFISELCDLVDTKSVVIYIARRNKSTNATKAEIPMCDWHNSDESMNRVYSAAMSFIEGTDPEDTIYLYGRDRQYWELSVTSFRATPGDPDESEIVSVASNVEANGIRCDF
jgi:hypothetical protein